MGFKNFSFCITFYYNTLVLGTSTSLVFLYFFVLTGSASFSVRRARTEPPRKSPAQNIGNLFSDAWKKGTEIKVSSNKFFILTRSEFQRTQWDLFEQSLTSVKYFSGNIDQGLTDCFHVIIIAWFILVIKKKVCI